MPREASKCREWEKVRRDRLKECFGELSKHLPCYDPSVSLSKVDILEKATKHIAELQSKTNKLLVQEDNSKTEKNEIKQLYERIKKLLLRNEQLSNLLKDAGIKIPKEIGVIKKFKSPLPWSNKISPEQAKILAKREAQRESTTKNKSTPQKKTAKSKPKIKSHAMMTVKHSKNVFKRCEGKKSMKKMKFLQQSVSTSKSLIIITQPSLTTNPCYIITNAPSKNIPSTRNSTVVTNSNLLSTPLVAASIKPPTVAIIPKKNTPLSSLGPGTLILANGSVVPVLPSIPAVLPTTSAVLPNTPTTLTSQPSVIVNSSTNSSTLLVVTTTMATKGKQTKTKSLPVIKPKIRAIRNVPINKIPIPAISSTYKIKSNMKKIKKDQKEVPVLSGQKNQSVENKENISKRKTESTAVIEEKRSKTAVDTENTEQPKSVKSYSVDSLCNENVAEPILETDKVEPSLEKDSKNDENKSDKIVSVVNEKQMTQAIVEKNMDENCTNAKSVVANPEKLEKRPKEPVVITETSETTESSTNKIVEEQNKTLELNLPHSELSNDIFASLQVPTGAQNPESTSPTAAFLLAFPLVSTLTGVKVSEVIEEDNSDSQRGTPTLLQIGTMDTTKPTQSQSESLTPNLLNLDNFSFFSSKDICNSFYPTFDFLTTTSTVTMTTAVSDIVTKVTASKEAKILYEAKDNLKVTSINKIEQPNMAQTSNNKAVAKYNNNIQPQPHDGNVQMFKNDLPKNNNLVSKSNFVYCSNTFNPFTDVPKSCSNTLYTTDINNSYNNYSMDQDTYASTKGNALKGDNGPYYYDNTCADYTKTSTVPQFVDNYCNKEKFNNTSLKGKTNPRPPVNWMTAPDTRQQIVPTTTSTATTDYLLPSVDFTASTIYSSNTFATNNQQTNYFNANSSLYPSTDLVNSSYPETRKSLDNFTMVQSNSFQRNDVDDRHFSWSPTKLHSLDTSHNFVSSTLPTLVGDLALGNTTEKNDTPKGIKGKESGRKTKMPLAYDNQSNLFSVSQLVDHTKTDGLPARTSNRRNSGNRSNKNNISQKNSKRIHKSENKDSMQNLLESNGTKNAQLKQHYLNGIDQNWLSNSNKSIRHAVPKNTSSSYSAEALIGQQKPNQIHSNYMASSKTFLPENIIPYFPAVDLPQDNSFVSQNQNYQSGSFSHNFVSTIQNNTYSTNSFANTCSLSTNYHLPTTNFMSEIGTTHEYNPVISDNINFFPHPNKQYNKNSSVKVNCGTNRTEERKANLQNCIDSTSSSNIKKSKRKHPVDSNLPGFVDFSFLSMPSTINSPILPDDFHTHTNFLPPPAPSQLYSCKNPLYPKQGTDLTTSSLLQFPPVTRSNNVQHPEISPSINNIGTSLANFNLSTIFPEINKGPPPLADVYTDPTKSKNFVSHRNYFPSTPQIPFTKPSFSTPYITTANSFSNG